MIDDASAAAAADFLARHRDAGTRIAGLPTGQRPRSREDGYAVQAHWMRHTRSRLYGWKIAATSEAGQRHINVPGPMAGRLLAERALPDGATSSLAGNLMRVVELEVAFRMGRDLAPRPRPYSVDEVLAAVATLHPALEIPDTRFQDFVNAGEAQLIADNACGYFYVPGPAMQGNWRAIDLAAHRVRGDVVGKGTHEGRGANALGDPRIALAWIANELSRLGLTLAAGEFVMTGTCVVPIQVAPGDEVRAHFGALGEMSVRFC